MIKLFGDRVAVREIDEEYKTEIKLVGRMNASYIIGKILAASENSSKVVSEGDVVLFQVPMHPIERRPMVPGHTIDGVSFLIQHYRDLIAKLPSGDPVVTLDNFQVLDRWCLVRAEAVKLSSGLYLPENVQENHKSDYFKFFLVQKGKNVPISVEVDDEIVVDPSRANPIGIGAENFYYIHSDCIYGVNEKAAEAAETQTVAD